MRAIIEGMLLVPSKPLLDYHSSEKLALLDPFGIGHKYPISTRKHIN